ncbi:MAG: MazG-like family protein [Parcubacteria group bacterium]
MNITDVQNRIHDFQKKRATELGADLTLDLAFMHLIEEVGEVARQIVNKKHPNFREFN